MKNQFSLVALFMSALVLGFEDTALTAGNSLSQADNTQGDTGAQLTSDASLSPAGVVTRSATRKRAGASAKGKGKGTPKADATDIPNVRRIQGKVMVRVVAMQRQKNGKLVQIGTTPIRQTDASLLGATLRFQSGRGYYGNRGTAPEGIKAKVQAAREAGSLVMQVIDHVTSKVIFPVPTAK